VPALSAASVSVPGYEILGELGRGGMGVVYKARQVSLDRLVALKMVLAGAHAGPDALARFRAEAEAVARLQHPNIVQVYEIGASAGVPYFSLEFVEGGALDRRLDGTPRPPADAARLVETLARAVQEAHARGIVHRDLKPANVLVSADGTPKIADFGLAKRLDAEGNQTRSGAVLGTPSYMAPEQAGGKSIVGPAADIYSLGAVLYELLTGRPPFKAASALDTVLLVVSEEPVAPSRVVPRLPRDLETVCLKCLEKDPARRYASAAALAEDLHRFLAGEPILCRPTPWWERVLKWARRRPAAAALLGVSAVALGVLLAVGLVYQAKLRQTNEDLAKALFEAKQERDKANREHQRAQGHLHKALEAVERMLTQVSNERLANVPGGAELRKQLLEEALDFHRGFLRQESDEPSVRRETARALFRIAALYIDLGRSTEAEQACREAVALQEKLVADFPGEADYQHDLGKSIAYLGHVYATTTRFQEAAKAYARALEIHGRLESKFPDRADYAESAASDHISLGFFNSFIDGRIAERHFRAATAIAQRLVNARPDPQSHCLLAASETNLAVQLIKVGRLGDAEGALDRARAALWPAQGPAPSSRPEYPVIAAKNKVWYGVLRAATNRNEHAEASLREGIAAFEALLQNSPGHFVHRNELIVAYGALASLYDRTGREEPAAATWKTGIKLADQMVKDYPVFQWMGLTADRMRVRALVTPARRGRLEAVLTPARALTEKKDLAGDLCYDLACVFALAAPASKDSAQSEDCARAAVALLRRAAVAGYFRAPGNVDHARKDEDLKSLRTRADFQKLLSEIGGKAAD
jgi:tetratricopeptide (TPR) repeat protein